MSQHSVLSPSSAETWTRCPGSISLVKALPRTTNEPAALGTCKHQVSYWALSHTLPNKTADGLQGTIECADGFSFTIDDEFVSHVNTYLKGVRAAVSKGDTAYWEVPLDTSPVLGVPGQSGTGDAVILRRSRRDLYVGDAKFGYGEVLVEGNRQLIVYGAAALRQFDEFGAEFDTVTLAIHQPRVRDLPIEHTYTVQEIRDFIHEWRLAAQAAMQPGANFNPGPAQCKWCKARGFCKAKADAELATFPVERPADASLAILTEDALAAALNRCDDIEGWCRDIRAEALRRARGGLEIPGYKVIEGRRGNRAWTDKSMALMALEAAGADPYSKPELVSPPEAERRLKKIGADYIDTISWLVEQPPGAPALAKIADARNPLPTVEFGLETPT